MAKAKSSFAKPKVLVAVVPAANAQLAREYANRGYVDRLPVAKAVAPAAQAVRRGMNAIGNGEMPDRASLAAGKGAGGGVSGLRTVHQVNRITGEAKAVAGQTSTGRGGAPSGMGGGPGKGRQPRGGQGSARKVSARNLKSQVGKG